MAFNSFVRVKYCIVLIRIVLYINSCGIIFQFVTGGIINGSTHILYRSRLIQTISAIRKINIILRVRNNDE